MPMRNVVIYLAVFLLGLLIGLFIGYTRTTRFYLRRMRMKYD